MLLNYYEHLHLLLYFCNNEPSVVLVVKTYSALVPEDASLLFSEDVLKSTPPSPILGAGAVVAAVEVAKREPKFKPPAAPRVVCPKPLNISKMLVNTPQSIKTFTKKTLHAMEYNV